MGNRILVFLVQRALGNGKRFKTSWMQGKLRVTVVATRVRPRKRGRKPVKRVAKKLPAPVAPPEFKKRVRRKPTGKLPFDAPAVPRLSKTGKRLGRPPKAKPVEPSVVITPAADLAPEYIVASDATKEAES